MTGEMLNANSKPSDSMVTSMAIFIGGAVVGALATLLLAPQAGRQSRSQLSEYSRRTGETMREWATAASDLFATGDTLSEAVLEAAGREDIELKW
jgi:gas vesicle protein